MRSAAKLFYLAAFVLFSPHSYASAPTKPLAPEPDICALEPEATVSDACVSYGTLDHLNEKLTPSLKALTQDTDFFAYYRLNLFDKECPFWNDVNGMCGNIACAVNTIEDEKDLPLTWRTEELSKLEGPKAHHPGKREQKERPVEFPLQGDLGDDVGESCVVEYDDECDERDYCVPDDEGSAAKGDYVSLVENPERYTGYSGESAHMVWDHIYRENCFSAPAMTHSPPVQKALLPGPSGLKAANELRYVLQENSPSAAFPEEDECREKRVFYRMISGMHYSISTHICSDYLNKTTGEWGPSMQCYEDRLAKYPERLANLYFNYALVLRAVAKIRPLLSSYTFCTGDSIEDQKTRAMVSAVAGQAAALPAIFDESLMFADPSSAPQLKEDFKSRFRNVSRVMDCVGCDKCRLWGKVQTSGYGTALKILFELQDSETTADSPVILKRTELVALINTLDRISTSLNALAEFRHRAGGSTFDTPNSRNTTSYRNPIHRSSHDPDDYDEEEGYQIPQTTSFMDDLRAELGLFAHAFKFILNSYIELPRKIMTLMLLEISRIWQWYLGDDIPDRHWTYFKWPSREDL